MVPTPGTLPSPKDLLLVGNQDTKQRLPPTSAWVAHEARRNGEHLERGRGAGGEGTGVQWAQRWRQQQRSVWLELDTQETPRGSGGQEGSGHRRDPC